MRTEDMAGDAKNGPDSCARSVRAFRWTPAGGTAEESCEVVREEAVTLDIPGVGEYVLLCMPDDPEALAVGFAFSEGLIGGREDATGISFERIGPWTSRVRIEIAGKPPQVSPRILIVSSSCGNCGKHIEDGVLGPAVGRTMRLRAGRLAEIAESMRRRQSVFGRTGGAHAAALFDAGGEIRGFAEDIGRHNALDKAVGRHLLTNGPLVGLGAMMSGRLSYELVAKAARAGLEILAGVSAPSSLAVETAVRRGMTLCGFVREGRLTVFAHGERIVGGEAPAG